MQGNDVDYDSREKWQKIINNKPAVVENEV